MPLLPLLHSPWLRSALTKGLLSFMFFVLGINVFLHSEAALILTVFGDWVMDFPPLILCVAILVGRTGSFRRGGGSDSLDTCLGGRSLQPSSLTLAGRSLIFLIRSLLKGLFSDGTSVTVTYFRCLLL